MNIAKYALRLILTNLSPHTLKIKSTLKLHPAYLITAHKERYDE